jgi:hypothetical protein
VTPLRGAFRVGRLAAFLTGIKDYRSCCRKLELGRGGGVILRAGVDHPAQFKSSQSIILESAPCTCRSIMYPNHRSNGTTFHPRRAYDLSSLE